MRQELNYLLGKAEVSKLVVLVGGNNIPNEPPDFLAFEIIDMLKYTRLEYPDMDVYCSAILQREHPCLLLGINHVNSVLFDACVQLGVKFISHNAFASNGEFNRPLFSQKEWSERRPTHLSVTGVSQLAINIKSALH